MAPARDEHGAQEPQFFPIVNSLEVGHHPLAPRNVFEAMDRLPQSAQSVPKGQMENVDPDPPSSHPPSRFHLHVFSHFVVFVAAMASMHFVYVRPPWRNGNLQGTPAVAGPVTPSTHIVADVDVSSMGTHEIAPMRKWVAYTSSTQKHPATKKSSSSLTKDFAVRISRLSVATTSTPSTAPGPGSKSTPTQLQRYRPHQLWMATRTRFTHFIRRHHHSFNNRIHVWRCPYLLDEAIRSHIPSVSISYGDVHAHAAESGVDHPGTRPFLCLCVGDGSKFRM